MDDATLIESAARGDRAAFELLVERTRDRVFWIAFRLIGDRELARDVTQEVYLRLYRVLPRFRAGSRFDAWLRSMTVHLGIDALRREKHHRAAAPFDDPGEPGAPRVPAAPAAADEAARGGEIERIFLELATLLSPKQRAAFVLREIEGLTTAEVAEALRTRQSTVRNHILQGRRILQEALRRRYPEYCRPAGGEQGDPSPRNTRKGS
jgi:RNA polymerase sigma-70 factor (ECF subfamily)